MKLNEELIVHDELNPKLFSDKDQLLPEVRNRLIAIVNEFIEWTEIDLIIADIQLVGSNASYNYSDSSDIDLHIITNFELIDAPKSLMQSLYNAKKTQFNDKFDIKIRGLDVEVYVQDIHDGVQSNGIYSVKENKWVKFPEKITSIPKYDFSSEVNAWRIHVDRIIANGDYDTIVKTLNRLYLIRHNSLAVDGEFGKGNLLFKELRNNGILSKLKDAVVNSLSSRLSLEELSKSQILNQDF